MPGKPVEDFFKTQLEAAGGWDVGVFERVASGETQLAIARSYGISQGFLARLIRQDPERKRAFREAKQAAAQVYADQAVQLIDDVPEERDAIAKAREQSVVRRWIASKYDRDQFGDQPEVQVNILNHGTMHLSALRHREVSTIQVNSDGSIADSNGNGSAIGSPEDVERLVIPARVESQATVGPPSDTKDV